MATGVSEADRERVRLRLQQDYEFTIDKAGVAKIVTKAGEVVTMKLKRPQRRLIRALMRQRAAGQPMRAIILKSRQVGMSTVVQVVMVIRATQTPNHLAVTVTQDRKTGAGLHKIGKTVWIKMPPQIKPPASQQSDALEVKYIIWGDSSRQQRESGILGLNSSYETATARTASAMRGRTINSLHFSEIAFYSADDAVLGVQNGVPDLPDTLICKESTANGHNWFKDEYDEAESGASGYYAMFSPWFEEDEYRRPFANERDEWEFERSIGKGTPEHPEYGEDEPDLLEAIPRKLREWAEEDEEPLPAEGEDPDVDRAIYLRTLEHLHWRRWAISAKCKAKVANFHQEYPSTPEEAFLSTGRKVFDAMHVRRALEHSRTEPPVGSIEHPGPAVGLLRGDDVHEQLVRRGVKLEIPRAALWIPASKRLREEMPAWRLWSLPQDGEWVEGPDGGSLWRPSGQYIVSVDAASGEEDDQGTEHADHAITVIDHRTLELVAEYTSQKLPDEVALDAYLAALFYNRALVVVERTGGWGLPILRWLTMDAKYPRVFERESVDQRVEHRSDRLGFSTDAVTKPMIVARGEALLRDHPEIFRSRVLLGQMLTYIRDKRGKMGPEAGKLADVLMAWLIAQHVASIRRVREEAPGGGKKRSKASGKPRNFRPRNDRGKR